MQTAGVKAVIRDNDLDAVDSVANQAKQTRKFVEGREHMSMKAMCTEDRVSAIGRALERADARVVEADARVVAAESSASASGSLPQAAAAAPFPQAKFGTGQSVLQWWTPWFASCLEGETPKQINRKN